MRLTIVHDGKGNITGLVAYPADGRAAYPETEPGELVTQVDVPEITGDLDAQKIFERLSDLAENYRIDVESKATLRKKVDSTAQLTKK